MKNIITNWLITNSKSVVDNDLCLSLSNREFSVYSKESKLQKSIINGEKISILIDGFILPRFRYNNQFSNYKSHNLVQELYRKYKLSFINYIKGNFIILLVIDNKFFVFNDRVGIRKFFHYNDSGLYFISNKLKYITDNIEYELDINNIAINSLMNHYIDGLTFVKDVYYSKQSTRAEFDNDLSIDIYWDADELLNLNQKKTTFTSLAYQFRDIVSSYHNYFDPRNVTMTLTGGNDSRMILAALLNINIKPRTFTFGNPESHDAIIASQIAKKCNLEYANYFVDNPSSDWFSKQASEIIEIGSSLINIFRAHRLDAIKQELEQYPQVEMIYTGFMGGDYTKGAPLDDYIITEIVRRWWFDKIDKRDLIIELLKKNLFEISQLDIEYIYNKLNTQKYFNNDFKTNEFYIIHNHVGGVHDPQDINVFNSYVKYVVMPFMDIDFLELLFSSQYSLLHRSNTSKNQFKRLKNPELSSHITNILSPELTNIQLSKYFSPKEYLNSKYLFIVKAGIRRYFGKRYPSSFPYKQWFVEFISNNINNINDSIINKIFNVKKLKQLVENDNHEFVERYWHKFNNVVILSFLVKYYKTKKK